MNNLLLALFLLVNLASCASTSTPIDIPVDLNIQGDTRDVNTSISNSVHNIVSQLEAWQMGVIVGLAWLVGWLSPGPLEIIRGFFGGLTEILKGFGSIFRGFTGLFRRQA